MKLVSDKRKIWGFKIHMRNKAYLNIEIQDLLGEKEQLESRLKQISKSIDSRVLRMAKLEEDYKNIHWAGNEFDGRYPWDSIWFKKGESNRKYYQEVMTTTNTITLRPCQGFSPRDFKTFRITKKQLLEKYGFIG